MIDFRLNPSLTPCRASLACPILSIFSCLANFEDPSPSPTVIPRFDGNIKGWASAVKSSIQGDDEKIPSSPDEEASLSDEPGSQIPNMSGGSKTSRSIPTPNNSTA